MKPEEILGFDEKNVFNNSTLHSCAFNEAAIHINFPEDVKKLYEDKIRLYEEQVALLKDKIRYLEGKV